MPPPPVHGVHARVLPCAAIPAIGSSMVGRERLQASLFLLQLVPPYAARRGARPCFCPLASIGASMRDEVRTVLDSSLHLASRSREAIVSALGSCASIAVVKISGGSLSSASAMRPCRNKQPTGM